MKSREVVNAPVMRVALGVLGASLAVLAWAMIRAFHAEPLPAVSATTVASLEAIGRGTARRPADIQAAVENDVFASDRSSPASPYRMPGESESGGERAVEPLKPLVLGTAVATDGRSFATLQLGDASPTLVHVGDKIGEWTVKSIQRGKVVLVSTSGTRADLTVPNPGL
jgi:hypothetical protein